MRVLGYDCNGRAVVVKLGGLEELDHENTLVNRHLGMLAGPPESHFLGSDLERSLGAHGGLRERWNRVRHQFYGGEYSEALWREAYREIGGLSSWLALPRHIRDEVARIYSNLRKHGMAGGRHRPLEAELAKITYLACLIHRLPRDSEDLERGLRELYGFGVGEIPREFIRALNTRFVRFTLEKVGEQRYLYASERIGGKRTQHRCLGRL